MDASKSRKTSSSSFASRSSYSVRTGSEEKCVSFYWNCKIKAEQVSLRQGNARIQFSFFLLLPLLNSQPVLPVTKLASHVNDNLGIFLCLPIACKIFLPLFPLIFTSSTRSIRSLAIDGLQIYLHKIHRNTIEIRLSLLYFKYYKRHFCIFWVFLRIVYTRRAHFYTYTFAINALTGDLAIKNQPKIDPGSSGRSILNNRMRDRATESY